MSLSEAIKRKALEIGFDIVGITDASPINSEHTKALTDWLKAGFAAQMQYMHRNFEKRTNPAALLDGARSVICVGLSYSHSPKSQNSAKKAGKVAIYAQYEDYHPFIKKQLRHLVTFIAGVVGHSIKFKICCDSTPLAERALAVRAGLGFIGKNHMLTHPRLGCRIFLGELITNLKLEIDSPLDEKCPDCHSCLNSCPTGALLPDGRFDANKCVSYLTIEHKDHIPPELAKKIADRLFGCDDCITHCSHQKNAPPRKNSSIKHFPAMAKLDLQKIMEMDYQAFDKEFADSNIKRLGLDLLKRNAQICLDNCNH